MELQDHGTVGRGRGGRLPRIAGGRGPSQAPPGVVTASSPPPEQLKADGAPLFDEDEIAAHLESSLDLSIFEPEFVDPTPLPEPQPELRGLLPDVALPSSPPALRSKVSPLSARRIQAPESPRRARAWSVALAAAALGAVVGYQLTALIAWPW